MFMFTLCSQLTGYFCMNFVQKYRSWNCAVITLYLSQHTRWNLYGNSSTSFFLSLENEIYPPKIRDNYFRNWKHWTHRIFLAICFHVIVVAPLSTSSIYFRKKQHASMALRFLKFHVEIIFNLNFYVEILLNRIIGIVRTVNKKSNYHLGRQKTKQKFEKKTRDYRLPRQWQIKSIYFDCQNIKQCCIIASKAIELQLAHHSKLSRRIHLIVTSTILYRCQTPLNSYVICLLLTKMWQFFSNLMCCNWRWRRRWN